MKEQTIEKVKEKAPILTTENDDSFVTWFKFQKKNAIMLKIYESEIDDLESLKGNNASNRLNVLSNYIDETKNKWFILQIWNHIQNIKEDYVWTRNLFQGK